MEEKILICADVIAEYLGKIVLVQRLNKPAGFALPGGKHDPGEFLSDAASREFFEETGLSLKIENVLGTFADSRRDPRGRYVSTVFIGRASGTPKDEPGKTKVAFLGKEELPGIKDQILFDHGEMLEKYLELLKKKKEEAENG
jgi:ADP-ribose pyrophosphatase YjhB (NUDIX family)